MRAKDLEPPGGNRVTDVHDPLAGWIDIVLTDVELRRIARFVEARTGIVLAADKRLLVESRLRKRLVELGLKTFTEYCDLALRRDDESDEALTLIDLMTTNHTSFFRERGHFDYLVRSVVPALGIGTDRPLRVWSAACSSGEEAYTLAMVLSEASVWPVLFRFEVHASDLCGEVLARARRGIYPDERIDSIPRNLRARHLTQSKDRSRRLVKIAPATRRLVQFQRINLVDEQYPFWQPFDVIFCRNVFIYFDRAMRDRILRRFCELLTPGGYLFLGHAEVVEDRDLPLAPVEPSVYRRVDDRHSG